MICEGWRRHGGIFTFGPVKWEQCKNEAIVKLTVVQDKKKSVYPACMMCWNECIEKNIKIVVAIPIRKDDGK